LKGQLERLDRRFFTCLDYDKLPETPVSDIALYLISNSLSQYKPDFDEFLNTEHMRRYSNISLCDNFDICYLKTRIPVEKDEEKRNWTAKDVNKTYIRLEKAITKLKEYCKHPVT